jgi:ribosomal protein L37E
MRRCEACGSYIITQEDIEGLRKSGCGHPDPVGEPGAPGVDGGDGIWKLYSSTMMECSVCGRHVPYHRYRYCPHCGSRNSMEAGDGK